MEQLDEKDLRILNLFYKRSLELKNSSILQGGKLQVSLKLHFEVNKGGTITIDGPEKEALKSLTTTIRQFCMNNETLYFNKIFKIIRKALESDKELFDNAKSTSIAFKKLMSKTYMKLQYGNKILSPADVIDFWFNGYIFHSDIENAERFERISKTKMFPFIKMEFESLMIDLSTLFIWTGNFIYINILKEQTKK